MIARELGVNTYGYIWSTPAAACVRRLAELGYRQFELMIHPPHLPLDDFDAGARRELRGALNEAGARRTALNMPSLDYNLASPLPRARAASVQMFADAIDLAADVGAEWLVMVPGRMSPLFPPSAADKMKWISESVAALLPRAEARGVGIAVENIPFAAFPDAISLGRFVRGFNSPRLAVCYDAANAHFIGEPPAEGIAHLGDLLRIVHLSDTGRDVWRHGRIGTGSVPFAEVARALAGVGFDGPCTLEIADQDPEAAILHGHSALVPFGYAPRGKESASR
ncbi:MAG TPA: sugar phosphate isomerase/epimerase family protein [Bradyrhizobium sp.]|uniref:sugar phosphate isomerase/epimerase family protein n=1 Tax=Bradyrhizobium sp. TaxID=376 RepID=UPI002B6C1901|nr:sugar phosphate isomerase/epimerase family protein [Bradyrhizobium sp.]HLZ05307.1 sugar phosphate isomerase/epimerase family protein [Bradyrhizobium sp.]